MYDTTNNDWTKGYKSSDLKNHTAIFYTLKLWYMLTTDSLAHIDEDIFAKITG